MSDLPTRSETFASVSLARRLRLHGYGLHVRRIPAFTGPLFVDITGPSCAVVASFVAPRFDVYLEAVAAYVDALDRGASAPAISTRSTF